MKLSTTLCIAVFSIAASAIVTAGPDPRTAPAADESRACVSCHATARAVLGGPMAMRSGQRAFAHRAFGHADGEQFFSATCSGCHVASCGDCHGETAHPKRPPANDACLRCHRGYSAGWEFEGKAPREDHSRYQRGATSQGEPYLRMLPDVHFERGMTCADCHAMGSMHVGGRKPSCRDCHPSPSPSVPEHAIAAHLETMECVSCHAAWAAQEYGTFLVRTAGDREAEAFAPLRAAGEWRRSAHLRRQDAPPLGVNAAGRVAPVRPRYILLVSDSARSIENRLVAAEWRTFTPHTVRRGTVTCNGCHENARRFLLEADSDRIYRIDDDGIPLRSYFNSEGQTVVNGSFMPRERYERMNVKSPEYNRQAIRQWQNILNHVAPR